MVLDKQKPPLIRNNAFVGVPENPENDFLYRQQDEDHPFPSGGGHDNTNKLEDCQVFHDQRKFPTVRV